MRSLAALPAIACLWLAGTLPVLDASWLAIPGLTNATRPAAPSPRRPRGPRRDARPPARPKRWRAALPREWEPATDLYPYMVMEYHPAFGEEW